MKDEIRREYYTIKYKDDLCFAINRDKCLIKSVSWRNKLMEANQYCIHMYIAKKHMHELAVLPAPVRESMIFRYYVQEIPLQIKEEDYFAGWYGFQKEPQIEAENPFTGWPWHWCWFEEKLEADMKGMFPFIPVMTEEEREHFRHMRNDLKIEMELPGAHTCLDYGAVLEKGLNYYICQVEKKLEAVGDHDYLKAMKMSLETCAIYAGRYAALAREQAEQTKDIQAKKRLERIYEALCQVPMHPARDFLEAVQCLWLMHTLIPMAEKSWASVSVGRVDQYLYPYYEKAMAEGYSKDEIKGILKQLFLLLDSYGDGACALNIGGMDIKGQDMMNELSEVLIEVEKEMSLRAPIIAVRVSPKTPDRILDTLVDFDLFKIGQPTFYNESACRKAVMERGIGEEEAAGFSCNSCMGLFLPESEYANMWGIKLNMHLPLELAVNQGKPFHSDLKLPLKTKPKEITCFEELIEKYKCYLAELIEICADLSWSLASEVAKNNPDPLLSALIEGCIENCGDRADCAKYNTFTTETMGLVNTCDALNAVRKLVFEQKKYTVERLVEAAKHNYENEDVLWKEIRNCPKFGTNTEETNALCREICDFTAMVCAKQNKGNRILAPSLHTIDANVWYGANIRATLDGRKNGEAICKNANPSHLLQNIDHTSHVLSTVSWDQYKFHGGQPIDLYFDKSWFERKELRDNIKALIRTYQQLGGLQFQVNSVDIALLEKAHQSPEDYPHVIVRKGGFSVRFVELSPETRKDMIDSAKRYS